MTNSQMVDDLNSVLNSFYGGGVTVSSKVRNLKKDDLMTLHEVAFLNQNDPIGEQVQVLIGWMVAVTSRQ
jgi:hypothetical protein